ncbi:SMC-Scp complex subunit ScpB [Ruicaihuangia caeni]|uniref:SMC-Scp complex subunit ScpB n=1 Tax=Ruicaihuangia caeni TaxID=3042517 RepID=UPI00338E85F2
MTIDSDRTDAAAADAAPVTDATVDPAEAATHVGASAAEPSGTAAAPATDAPALFEGDLERVLEAILMVADEPQSVVSLASALGRPVREVREAIARLKSDYDGEASEDGAPGIRRGFELREVAGGWRIYVRSEYDDAVRGFVLTQTPTKLSQAALETLAVIAYKQPISRGQVAAIRAVNVDSVVRTLLGRGLITEAFTDAETGAIHYATTDLMLQQLGINSIDELPPISPLLDDGAEGFQERNGFEERAS